MRISDWSSDVCSSDLLRSFQFDGRRYHSMGTQERRVSMPALPKAGSRRSMSRRRSPNSAFTRRTTSSWRITCCGTAEARADRVTRSEEHTSELQSLMRISYAVFCLQKKTLIKDMNKTNTKK